MPPPVVAPPLSLARLLLVGVVVPAAFALGDQRLLSEQRNQPFASVAELELIEAKNP